MKKADKSRTFLKQTIVCYVFPLLAGAAVYLLATTGAGYLLSMGYDRWMSAWGVTDANLPYAPWWVLLAVYGAPILSQALQCALLFLCLTVLARLFRVPGLCSPFLRAGTGNAGEPLLQGRIALRKESGGETRSQENMPLNQGDRDDSSVYPNVSAWKRLLAGAGIGCALALAAAGLLLLADSVRMGRPLAMPQGGAAALMAILAAAFTVLGETLFFPWFAYKTLRARGCGFVGAVVAVSVMYMALHGWTAGGAPLAIANAGLMMCLVCLLCAQTGSVWTGFGVRFGFVSLCDAVLGFAGSDAALYELYPSSRAWLSGGENGVMAGLMMTALLLAVCALCVFQARAARQR